jgi:hypothetical protein
LGLTPILEQSGMYPLEPWQLAFCKWLAAHPHSRFRVQCDMASSLAGTDIGMVEIRQMRARKNFRAMYGRYRANILQRMDEHRENFESVNITKAIKAHAEAIDLAVEAKDYRAIPALVDPAIKALYKHTDEQAEKPMIVLNLGGMAGRLDEPPTEVEHEMLPAEIEEHDEPSI